MHGVPRGVAPPGDAGPGADLATDASIDQHIDAATSGGATDQSADSGSPPGCQQQHELPIVTHWSNSAKASTYLASGQVDVLIPYAPTGGYQAGSCNPVWKVGAQDPFYPDLDEHVGMTFTGTIPTTAPTVITHEQWYTAPASMPPGVHTYALKIRKPGQSAWTVIPSTNTLAGPGQAAVLNITKALPDMSGDDFFNTLNKIRPELATYASRTSWGLSEY